MKLWGVIDYIVKLPAIDMALTKAKEVDFQ